MKATEEDVCLLKDHLESREGPPLATQRRSFRCMGTSVTLIAPLPGSRPVGARFEEAFEIVRRTFVREDERFSRFRNGTEISLVNASAGAWTSVSAPFLKVMQLALEAARITDGLFDPTVLPALLALGYDRDFDDVIAGARLALHPPEPCGRWQEIESNDGQIRLPPDVALDFGGIAKGWTVDKAARRVKRFLPWALVDAGGDLRIVGRSPRGGLSIGVEDPLDSGEEILRLRMERGALATSSVTMRSWGPGIHHLIDPRTGRPADTGVVEATTVLRRSAVGEPARQIEIGDVWIDPAMREASVRGVRLQLPAREFDLLCLLMQNAGRVVRREDIMDELWGGDWFGSTKTLDVHVGRLRRRIGAGTGVDGHITTIRRVGFRFATEDDLALSPRRPPAVAAKQPRAGWHMEREVRSGGAGARLVT
jgi:thiamine biosynthesis lipoprotein